MNDITIIDCPALHSRSKHYPKRYHDRVPRTVRMLCTVRPDFPFLQKPENKVTAEEGEIYPAWTNSHGAVAAVIHEQQLGLRPDEFEVVSWHILDPADPASERQRLLERARKLRDEITQIFNDAEYWNTRVRKPDQALIDPDPEGKLRAIAANLDKMLRDEPTS